MMLLGHVLAEEQGQPAAGHKAGAYDLWHLPGTLTVINPPAIGLKSVAPGLLISGTVH